MLTEFSTYQLFPFDEDFVMLKIIVIDQSYINKNLFKHALFTDQTIL
jgi:hypothetical protein